MQDSNLQPSECKSDALPIELIVLVLSNWCSILELVRTHFAAAGGEEIPPAKIRKGGGAAPLTI